MEGLYKNKYRTKSIRYEGYDYSQAGFYFITICVKNKDRFFGNIKNKSIVFSDIGRIAYRYWLEIPKHFSFAALDLFVIMPDHIHAILAIKDVAMRSDVALQRRYDALQRRYDGYDGKFPQMSKISPTVGSISTIIRSYKSVTTKNINIQFPDNNFVWQPKFYDRIIRDQNELDAIRQYIIDNPLKWELDKNNKF